MAAAYWLGRNRLYLQVTNRVPNGITTLYKARGPGFKLSENFTPITKEPTEDELAAIVENAYEHDERKIKGAGTGMGEGDEGVVFAGIGEPLLRLDVILRAMDLIKERRHGVPLCLNTTGHGVDDITASVTQMKEAGLDKVSVFIPSANPQEYGKLMGGNSMGKPCEFLSVCVDQGIICRVVTVNNGQVDVKAVRDLSSALGAVEFEAKAYFA